MSDRTPAAIRNAEKTNDKLFPLFEKNLSSESPAEFATAADKLTIWLSNSKAYYGKARPTIVSLLEIARETVRRQTGFAVAPSHISRCSGAANPWVESYEKLVRAVVPFVLLFPEPFLQLRLRAVLQTICENVDDFLSQQTLVPPSVASNQPVLAAPFSPSSSLPSPSTIPQMAQPRQMPPELPQPSPVSPSGSIQVGPVAAPASAAVPVSQSPAVPLGQFTPTPPSTTPAVPTITAPSLPRLHITMRSATTPVVPTTTQSAAEPPANPGQGRPKAKKRKTMPIDADFIMADLVWYKGQHSTDSGPQESPSAGTSVTAPTPPTDTAHAHTVPNTPSEDLTSVVAPSGIPSTSDQDAPSSAVQGISEVKSRSPSAPLRGTVHQPVTVQANQPPDDEACTPARDAPAAPQSPIILGPSLTRRPTDSDGPPAIDPAKETPPPKAATPPVGEKLPSPLATKGKGKKRRRGPPGLKYLPVPFEDPPPEAMSVDDPSPAARETSTASKSPSMPLAPQLASRPASRAGTPRETLSTARVFEETTIASTVESPVPMNVDGLRPESIVPDGDAPQAIHHDPEARQAEVRDQLNGATAVDGTTGSTTGSTPDANNSRTPLFLPSSSESSMHLPREISPHGEARDLEQNMVDGSSLSINTLSGLDADRGTTRSTSADETPSDPSADAPNALADEESHSSSPFASTDARVLSIARGAPSITPAARPVVLDFELTADELAQIARWKRRGQTVAEDLSTSLCISFATYPLSQCVENPEESPDGISDITKCGAPGPWPQDGSAFVALNNGEGSDRFSIAPPFITTVDKCIDFGTRNLREGTNTLHLFQYRDHSDRVFVVVLHHPTHAQLAELRVTRDKEREWRRALEGLGRIELRVPRLFPSTMANVVSPS